MFIKYCFSLIYKVQTFAHFHWSLEEYKSKKRAPRKRSALWLISYKENN